MGAPFVPREEPRTSCISGRLIPDGRASRREGAPKRALVVENATDVRALLCEWLAELGFQFVAVTGATDALREIESREFAVVVTAVLLEDGDGLELIMKMRATRSGARIVAVSGEGRYLSSRDCLKLARALGAHATMAAPFTREKFRAAFQAAWTAPQRLGR